MFLAYSKQKLKIFYNHPFISLLCVWYFFAWSWAFVTDSLDLAGSKTVAMVIAFWVVLFNVAISTYIVVKTFKFLKVKFKKAHPIVVLVLGLPLFALMDFMISWLTAIIWIGPQGSFDNVLPLSSPTLILINTPFKYAARILGFYGLAAFFWLFIFLVSEKKYRKLSIFSIGLLTVISLIGWGLYKTPNGLKIKTTIVSENLNQHVGVLQDRNSDLVVLPEYSLDQINNENLNKRIGKNQNSSKTSFVGSQQVMDGRPAGHLNVLLFGNSEEGILEAQDKYRLIPGGEDLAYIARIALRATNQKATLDYFSYAKMVNKGPNPLEVLKVNEEMTLGSAVCSSIIAPKDYQNFAKDGATILTNSASLTIFKGSRVFAWQQKSLARFMATANSRYFLQSANAASAYVLDNNGKQLAEVRGIEAKDVVAVNNSVKTPYTMIGEFLVAIGSLIVVIWLVNYLIRQNSGKFIKLKKYKSRKNHNK